MSLKRFIDDDDDIRVDLSEVAAGAICNYAPCIIIAGKAYCAKTKNFEKIEEIKNFVAGSNGYIIPYMIIERPATEENCAAIANLSEEARKQLSYNSALPRKVYKFRFFDLGD